MASVLKFLFPAAQEPPPPSDTVAVVEVPFRIGVAFVPDEADPVFRLSETDRLKLASQVRDAFAKYPFIREIEAVPSLYLEPGGGFANLDRIAALLRLDVIALVSYDQVQHAGASGWSFLYWTGIGAYVIQGGPVRRADRRGDHRVRHPQPPPADARRGHLDAEGQRHHGGLLARTARAGRTKSFDEAVKQMIGNLHGEVKAFRERAPKDPMIKLVLPPGYDPNATQVPTR